VLFGRTKDAFNLAAGIKERLARSAADAETRNCVFEDAERDFLADVDSDHAATFAAKAASWTCREHFPRISRRPKKVRPALGGRLAARDPVWDGEGWGYDRVA
jgi:hypothetical protein